ncbi:MAG: branched-chain amino acid ABC transporter permease [Elusimicrobia bacterium]|nr:branched-chain amino acid ABC transporter permease [Elusimicrobiota bacterium]
MGRRIRIRSLLVPVILLAVFAALPLFLQVSEYAYIIRLLGLVGLYITIALGLNLVVGLIGLLDLGFMAFYAIGAYSMALLSMRGMSFWLALPACTVIAMSCRAALGAPVLRLRGDYLAIVTLGFGEITRIVLNNWDSVTRGPKGISLLTDPNVRPIRFFGHALVTNTDYYYLILALVIAGVLVSERLKNSRIGRAWMAIREDEVAARLTGVQVTRMKMIGFVTSAAFAGAAGGVFARWESFVTPESFTFWESVMLVAMVVIGGMGSVPGALMGVAIVMLVPELLRNVLGPALVSWRYLLFGVALVIVAVYRPEGLWPGRRSRPAQAGVEEAA